MNRHAKWMFAMLAITIPVWIASCNKAQPPEEHGESHGQEAAQPGTQAGHDEHAEPGHGQAVEPTQPAGSAAAIWAQIAAEQAKLEDAMQSGALADVHHLAFGIRDLVLELAKKTPSLAASDAAKLQELVEDVKVRATKLDEYGDNGNLSGVKEEYALLQKDLEALKAMTSAP